MVSTAARSAAAPAGSHSVASARTPGASHLAGVAGRRPTRHARPQVLASSTSTGAVAPTSTADGASRVAGAQVAGPRPAGDHESSAVLRAQAAAGLLGRADAELLAAQLASDPAERFGHAHMAALRVAGAVLAVLGSRPPRGRTRSAWERLAAASDGFAPWASFFASGARLRSAVDAGRFDAVDESAAARWVAAAEDFRDEVGLWVEDDSVPLASSIALTTRSVSA